MRSIINIFGAVCLLAAMFGCGANSSKKTASEETVKQLPRLSVVGTQLMNENGDTVVLRGVSYGWHQFWPRFIMILQWLMLPKIGERKFSGLLWE